MSNSMAIATVTAALSQVLLQPVKDAVGSNAAIKFSRPSAKDDGPNSNPQVNVYLYQVTPNPAFRNADLPTRRGDGTLIRRPVAALDLHYLFTFHGNDDKLEPQLMLGAVSQVLQSQPMLSPPIINSTIGLAVFNFLANSDLASQVETVRFTPAHLSLEEFSKLWSAFFQVEYRLSVAYQASVVLIEPQVAAQESLPVLARNIYVSPFRQPTITQVNAQAGVGQPILPSSNLVIRGTQLLGGITAVRLGNQLLTPGSVTDKAIVLPVPAGLPAGVQTVQVVQQEALGTPAQPHPGVESNVFPLVLQPIITPVKALPASVEVKVNPAISPGQRVTLLLNQATVPATGPAAAYSYVLPTPIASVNDLTFVTDIPALGLTYFIRLSVDGAESPLDMNPASPTYGPTVTI
jgi:hypothetical protein